MQPTKKPKATNYMYLREDEEDLEYVKLREEAERDFSVIPLWIMIGVLIAADLAIAYGFYRYANKSETPTVSATSVSQVSSAPYIYVPLPPPTPLKELSL